MKKIKTLVALKRACYGEVAQFAIALQHGCYSKKYIFYNHVLNRFDLENCIDGTEEKNLTAEELLNTYTNIGKVMKSGHFYQLN